MVAAKNSVDQGTVSELAIGLCGTYLLAVLVVARKNTANK